MSFTSSPARHGMQSPLSMQKASPRLKGKQPIGSPDPRSAGKKRGEEDFRNRTPTPNPAASENCDPNFSDGAVKTKNLEPPMFAVASGIHSCKSRRCASNNPDWMTTGVRVQPRKFLVAKRYLQQQQEPSICKCCDKKISADASVRKKCVCGAPKQLRVSQEDFVKENLEALDCAGEETRESLMCRESDFHAPENAYVHIVKNEQGGIQSGEEGANGFCENADDGIHGNIRSTEEEAADGFSGIGHGGVHEKIQSAEAGANGFSEIADDGVNERTQGPEAGANGFYEIAEEGVDEKTRNPGVGTGGFSENGDGEIHAKIQCAEERNYGFACQAREQSQCYEEGAHGFDGSESNPTASAAADPLLETGWISSSQKMSAVPRRLRNELLEEAINTIPQQGGGRVKHLVKAFESLMSLPDSEIVEAEGYQARPLDKSIYNVSQFDQDKHRLAVGRGLKWALPGMQPQVSGESSSSPSGETYAHFKFRISEDAASVGHSESQSVDSFGKSECSFGSRRRSKKESLDSSGRGSLGKNGTHPWKKQLKVTGAQPFKLRTEQRGHMKEREFMKKVQEMIAEEEKHRIPIAQGLPWTTDEPEHLLKPPVKENTKPLDIKLHTEARAVDRAEFDHTISEKLTFLEQQKLEEERLQKLAEEEEIKRLRRELIPRAQPMPFFDRPFIPKRSSKNPTIPKEPKFHVPHHKRAKSISWNDFNVCQQ